MRATVTGNVSNCEWRILFTFIKYFNCDLSRTNFFLETTFSTVILSEFSIG